MAWIETTPTESEKERLPVIGSHWISNKIDRAIANGKPISKNTKKRREIVVTGYRWRDDECCDSLQVNFRLAVDPDSDIFMTPLSSFYDKYRANDK